MVNHTFELVVTVLATNHLTVHEEITTHHLTVHERMEHWVWEYQDLLAIPPPMSIPIKH